MECVNHPGVEPVARCVRCGAELCSACAIEKDGRYHCVNCLPHGLRPGDLRLQRAYSYIFDDPQWIKKVAIGALLALGSILVIPYFFLLGYSLEIVRMVAAGEDRGLPEWHDWGDLLTSGAKLAVVKLAYLFPVLVLMVAVYVPIIIELTRDHASRFEFWYTPLLFLWVILAFLWMILYKLVTPAYTARFARTGSIKSGLRFRAVARMIRVNIGAYIVVMLLLIANGYIAGFGWLACLVGVFFTYFYAMVVNSHLYGQLARADNSAD